jgi:flagellar hook-basal body protein
MSINSAMMAGVSGLGANASALAAISDNIANVNTVAYKRNQVNFATQVTAQVAGHYSAGGVQGTSRQYVGQQGLLQSAASPTDLAISGDGFFVTAQKAAGLTASDPRLFTRAGAFTIDGAGYPMGRPLGQPHDANGQRAVLRCLLDVLATAREADTYVELPFVWPESPAQARNASKDLPPPPIVELLTRKPWLLANLYTGRIPNDASAA